MIKIPSKYKKIREKTKGSQGFMGLSVGKKLFGNKKVIREYAEFMSKHFSESYFLIADLPKKYNIMAIEGISEQSALTKVMRAGYCMRIFLERITEDFPNVYVKNYSELQDENYWENLKVLKKAYMQNKEFRDLCQKDVRKFLNLSRNKEKIECRNFERVLKIAVKYRIDELAILLSIPLGYEKFCEICPEEDELHEKLQRKEFDFCSKLRINPKRMFMEAKYND